MVDGNFRKAVLFVDVVGSVDLFSATSDEKATREIQSTITQWADAVVSSGGAVVKHLGDGLLCLFDQMEDACNCLSKIKLIKTDYRLSSHAGLHDGEVLLQDDDVFGQTINLAARLASYAAPGEIVASKQAVDAMPAHMAAQTRFLSHVTPKGFTQQIPVFQFSCGDQDRTMITPTVLPVISSVHNLILSIGDRTIEVGGNLPKFTIGRSEDNSLCVEAEMVSRQHATIRYSSGGFSISDHSTNGTWILSGDGDKKLLMRQTRALRDSGHIGLGLDPEKGEDHAVSFLVLAG